MLARGTERRYLLETVQGYVILKAATFETGHGFALGHNPGASSLVTWQFTEGKTAIGITTVGCYGTSRACRGTLTAGWTIISAVLPCGGHIPSWTGGRLPLLFHPAARGHRNLPKPPDNQPLSIVNYDDDRRRPVADGRLMAWGELTYAKPLTESRWRIMS